jgi:hypothetical protein
VLIAAAGGGGVFGSETGDAEGGVSLMIVAEVGSSSFGINCNTPIVIAPIVAAAASGIHQRQALVAAARLLDARGPL